MGLDTVELVMEMEETFGIVIDDLDAEQIGTVGQAYRYILGKLELKHSSPCPSAALFYRLRRALMARSGADRRSIRLAARIEDFLPRKSRRDVWIGLRDEVGMTMPRLQYGPGLMLAVWFLGLTQILGLLALVIFTEFSTPVVMSSLVLGLFSWIMIRQILDPFATEIPRGCQTVRGTVETILGRHRLAREGDIRTWQRDEVWFTLRELISKQVGVPQDDVTEEKSFVYDFGMD